MSKQESAIVGGLSEESTFAQGAPQDQVKLLRTMTTQTPTTRVSGSEEPEHSLAIELAEMKENLNNLQKAIEVLVTVKVDEQEEIKELNGLTKGFVSAKDRTTKMIYRCKEGAIWSVRTVTEEYKKQFLPALVLFTYFVLFMNLFDYFVMMK